MSTEDARAHKLASANQPHNKKNLAELLGVTPFILKKMIELVQQELGEPAGTIYSVNQVQFMVRKYGIMTK